MAMTRENKTHYPNTPAPDGVGVVGVGVVGVGIGVVVVVVGVGVGFAVVGDNRSCDLNFAKHIADTSQISLETQN